eukprot:Pgem_evm1s10802
MYKGLFRTCGVELLEKFLPYLTKLVKSSEQHSHRLASEIVAGVVRGSKHWKYEAIMIMSEHLVPLIDHVLKNMHSKMRNDWAC